MVYLILDTNIWIYLANGSNTKKNDFESAETDSSNPKGKKREHFFETEHFEFLNWLFHLQNKRKIRILVNQIIIDEWHRNKDNTLKQIEKIKNQIESEENEIRNSLKKGKKDGIEAKRESINTNKKAIEDNLKHIENVEDFMSNQCIMVNIRSEIKLKVFDISLTKKAPFHNSKNNNADAAILLSCDEYLKGQIDGIYEIVFFVSNNYRDFADESGKKFHSEISEILINKEIEYLRYLDDAIKEGGDIIHRIEDGIKPAIAKEYMELTNIMLNLFYELMAKYKRKPGSRFHTVHNSFVTVKYFVDNNIFDGITAWSINLSRTARPNLSPFTGHYSVAELNKMVDNARIANGVLEKLAANS